MDSITSSQPSGRQPHAAFPIGNLDPFGSADGVCVVTSGKQLLPTVKATTCCNAPLSNAVGDDLAHHHHHQFQLPPCVDATDRFP